MKKAIIALALAAGIFTVTGCTDAEQAQLFAYGSKTQVKCYSGGVLIFEDESTGKVSQGEAGIYYKSSKTQELVHTYADCIVMQEP